jgi:hypothetical protein
MHQLFWCWLCRRRWPGLRLRVSSAAPLELVTFSVPFAGCLSENASSPASFWSAYLEVLLGSEGPSINTV